ncbi:hypothetical protein KTT_23790 [Tengunoibacter tsumagoiensis]|uniref:Uncharacterized protein n=2 Tax=Tengunoibacter tsumagoiensis TaxID=2014871 RepID=A0A402A043_9CHLR|nr:hypothetical protein KTT_23790 [Tengunoibacter tsumagoiensis]
MPEEVFSTVTRSASRTITFEFHHLIARQPQLDAQQQRRLKRLCWTVSGFLLLLALVMNVWLVPHSSPITNAPGRSGKGGVSQTYGNSICGHADDVFHRLGFASAQVPTTRQLQELPRPGRTSSTDASTYDPATDVLCTSGWNSLYTQFVQTHASMMGAAHAPTDSVYGLDWVQGILGGLLSSCMKGLGDFLNQVIGWFNSLLFFISTPHEDTDQMPVVAALHGWMVTVVGSALGLILVIGGYNYMLQPNSTFREMAPRLAFAAIAAALSMTFIHQFIDLSNELCLGVQSALVTAGIGDLNLPLGIINWPTAPVYEILTYLIDLVMCLLLGIEMLVRIATLDLLIVLAPLGMLCFALPQTIAWERLWVQSFVATLIVQFLQEICIGMGSALIGSFGHASMTIMSLLIGIAALYVAFKVPNMLLSSVVKSTMGEVHRDFGNTIRSVAETALLMAA